MKKRKEVNFMYSSSILRFKIALIAICISITFSVYTQKDTLSLLHITDTHLMFNLENYDAEIVNHRENTRGYKGGNYRFERFMQTTPEATGSNMIVATGDLIDFFSATNVAGRSQAYQVEQFARFLDNYPQPLLLTLGNHDVFSYIWGKGRVIPNQLDAERARAAWIRNFDCFREGTYYSRTVEVGEANYRFIFLDNSYYRFKKEENVVNPYIDKPQLHWLKNQLNKSDNETAIIFMHLPLTDKSVLPESNNKLYEVLSNEPSVKLILAGHRHRARVKSFKGEGSNEIIQVETAALVRDENNWRHIYLTEDSILVSSMGKMDKEITVLTHTAATEKE